MEERHIIDCHTHILPGIDDGSGNIDMTREMLKIEKRDGITDIVFTPHFYASRNSITRFLNKRNESFEKVLKILSDVGFSEKNLYLGSEVYYFENMSKAEDLDSLCISGTNYILIEMPFAQWTKKNIDEIEYIINERKLNVILAHLERFYKFQKDKEYFDRLLSMDLLIQLNAEAFLGGFFQKRWVDKLLAKHDNILLGSDCHNLSTRTPNLVKAREQIRKKHGQNVLDKIDENGKRICHE